MSDNDIVTRLREIDGFGWQCGKPLKDKGTYLRCGCGCSQPADGMEDGMTVSRPAILGEAADEIEHLRAERDEARQRMNSILTEIDCRIEHGAESNGHLEVLHDMFKENTDA